MSLPDTVFIFVLALIIFGPKKLPEIGRQIGRLVGEFRRASNEFKFQIEEELRQVDVLEKRTPQPEISKPVVEPAMDVAEAAMDKDSSTLPMLSQEPADPAEILPVGQYPNIATLDTAELDPLSAPLSELNGSSMPAEIPETAEQTTAGEIHSAPPPIAITPAPGSQPRTTQLFAASAPPADSFSEPLLEPSLEPVAPANRPPSRVEAEVTHG